MSYLTTEAPTWRRWVTPRRAREQRVHRWYLFPHSFTGDLVHALVDEWKLAGRDRVLDPFAGAGTTLVAAKERGVPATGCDLSPLAVLVSSTKITSFRRGTLIAAWHALQEQLRQAPRTRRIYPDFVRKALPDGRLEALDAIAGRIDQMTPDSPERDFFRLALLATIPSMSHAVADGGWLRWLNQGEPAESAVSLFDAQVELMLSDVPELPADLADSWNVHRADARSLPIPDASCSAVITSPPYPNRHDYTRVFGVELLFDFLDWEGARALRYQSLHSHPEARPKRPPAEDYRPPSTLDSVLRQIGNPRVTHMLRGYFLDLHLCLRELVRVCRGGARLAIVVGNARYDGMVIMVDEFVAELGERAGLTCQELRAVRWRGNSAQQMGRYGRVACRESIVMFEKRGD